MGQVNWVITTKMPWRDKDGKIIGTFGVSRDITALKEAEEKLAEYTRQLEQKNKQTAEELKMARELQLAMLPHEFPCVPRHKPRAESDLDFFSYLFPGRRGQRGFLRRDSAFGHGRGPVHLRRDGP